MMARLVTAVTAFVLAGVLAGAARAGTPLDSVRARAVPIVTGWYPPADPESASVRRGRRRAPAVALPLAGGRGSLEELARAALAAVSADAPESLLALCVTKEEFEVVMWPEFPQSRPATGLLPMDGWRTLSNRLTSGSFGAASDGSGHAWTLVRVERGPVMEFRNFGLHRGLGLVARDETGQETRMDFLRTAVERRGVFKIYSMRD